MTDNQTTSEDGDAAPIGPSYEKQHAKVLRFELTVGADDSDRTIEQFEADIRAALTQINGTPIHNTTLQGGYYIIDGKVCLTQDYDPTTKNRIPGTFPPVWAGGPDPKKPAPLYVDDDTPRDFVRVKPTIQRRDPLTGRRARKDKGVKRGPRNPVSAEARDAIAKMGEELKAEVQPE